MKHIKKEYGTGCNLVLCTYEEYEILRIAFEMEGVKLRTVKFDSKTVIFQIINPYKNSAEMYNNKQILKHSKMEFEKCF